MEPKSYNTKQKSVILEFLQENINKNLTADEILYMLYAKGNQVSKSTLYRYLDVLTTTGDVRKYVLPDSDKTCYQYLGCDNSHEHFHLKCMECGKLIHMECDDFSKIIAHVSKEHHFDVDPDKIILYGKCEDCRGKV